MIAGILHLQAVQVTEDLQSVGLGNRTRCCQMLTIESHPTLIGQSLKSMFRQHGERQSLETPFDKISQDSVRGKGGKRKDSCNFLKASHLNILANLKIFYDCTSQRVRLDKSNHSLKGTRKLVICGSAARPTMNTLKLLAQNLPLSQHLSCPDSPYGASESYALQMRTQCS